MTVISLFERFGFVDKFLYIHIADGYLKSPKILKKS